MLIQCLLLMFGLLGIAAVAVDFGLARITQVQMQSGVDTAALEGLRMRDELPELHRRSVAREFAAATYANPESSTGRVFGAGPIIGLTDGQTAANALRTIQLAADSQYRPCLALNLPNVPNGDMVSGSFLPERTGPDDYARDLQPDNSKNAFLVRMRRTGYFPSDSPDAMQPEPSCGSSEGTVSVGPPLPLLFGMGSVVTKSDTTDYSVRLHGFTVRATAVAAGRPARRVSAEYVAPFVIARRIWAGTESQRPSSLRVISDGRIVDSDAVVYGYTVIQPMTRIGERFSPAGLLGRFRRQEAYVPIYDSVDGESGVIIGYGFAYVLSNAADHLQFTPIHTWMAAGGASSRLLDGPVASPSFIRDLYQKNNKLEFSLQSPVLVR